MRHGHCFNPETHDIVVYDTETGQVLVMERVKSVRVPVRGGALSRKDDGEASCWIDATRDSEDGGASLQGLWRAGTSEGWLPDEEIVDCIVCAEENGNRPASGSGTSRAIPPKLGQRWSQLCMVHVVVSLDQRGYGVETSGQL